MNKIYLDYAAATPMREEVLEAMKPYFSENFYNPSATYLAARAARQDLEEARGRAAQTLGAKPAEIIFTAGATEANNLAISGIAQRFSDGQILVSAIEHDSVLAPARRAGAQKIPVWADGRVNLDKLAKLISDRTVLISVGLINNEIGTIQPLKDIASLVSSTRQKRLRAGNRRPLYLHTDAAQAPSYLDLHVARLGVDLMSINGGKIYGPKQTGLLYVKSSVELMPQIIGGGQEFNKRAGTENLPGVVGLAKALELAQADKSEGARVKALRNQLAEGILKLNNKAQINGPKKLYAPHILSVSFAGRDNERLMFELDEAGIECGLGSACSADSGEPSHVLKAIGLSDELARATLRFSLGAQTSSAHIEKTLQALKNIL
ncbi:MAG TPA: cysteine desulfurase family protein [Candidatus Saccharimonadales bacterium]|nr:cysteine desulfurase family protein [Candidatus Saccharimonadales bacterium]